MSRLPPAFYARTGTRIGDLRTLLHVPYTLWHLSYVVIGAALAPDPDPVKVTGTAVAFAFGLGVGAHALDELHGRPLGTRLTDAALTALGWGGLGAGLAVGVVGAVVISPWTVAWAVVGVALAAGYALEASPLIHSTVGFGVAWGAFPVLVGFWAQTETVTAPAVVVAVAAAMTSMVQRALSTPARTVRRRVETAGADIGDVHWDRDRLLESWERPLRLLAAAHVVLAVGLLAVGLTR